MRMLVARVGGRIEQGKKKLNNDEQNASYSLEGDEKLEALLDMAE